VSDLELLLRVPRPAKRTYAWEQLTTGDHLFYALRESLQGGVVSQATTWLKTWQTFAGNRDERVQRQWHVIKSLLICAHIAALDSETAFELPRWLHEIDDNASLAAESECRTAALDSEQWPQRVRSQLHQVAWPLALNAAWAWDAIATFRGSPRLVARSEHLDVLLVSGSGVIAQLTLEQLSDRGSGSLYPDPATMSFVTCDQEFQAAEQNAVGYVRAIGLWRDGPTADVRWKMTRRDAESFSALEGGSAGGAFALGLVKLLAGASR
jgi:hypothetical protein